MPRFRLAWLLAAGAMWSGAALVWGGPNGRNRAAANKPESGLKMRFFPAELTCGAAGCHSSPKTTREPLVCRCTEFATWKKDKHADAFKALQGKRGREMAKLLGYDVTQNERCLSCHGVHPKYREALDENFKPPDEGVTCSVCHGPYEEWYSPHQDYPNYKRWRKLSRREKQAKGMTDLWDPETRATLCASCHVGNLGEGKFVSHEMYAAGHPPLPSFEPASFSDQMPRHWEYRREKSRAVQKILPAGPGGHEVAQLVLVGAAVNLRESMRLLAAQAARSDDPDRAGERGLDLANFDCYACHHDLKGGGRRQTLPFVGKPGRVPMRTWPTTLVELAVRHAAADPTARRTELARFNRLVAEVRNAFDARPYGDPKLLAPAADALQRWAARLAKKLDKPCDTETAARLMADLARLYQDRDLDFDSARQVGWALKAMRREYLTPAGAGSQDAIADPDKVVAKGQRDLDRLLKLRLLSTRSANTESELGESLKSVYRFDPDPFKIAMRTIATRLRGK